MKQQASNGYGFRTYAVQSEKKFFDLNSFFQKKKPATPQVLKAVKQKREATV
jgi:hypothetical protein